MELKIFKVWELKYGICYRGNYRIKLKMNNKNKKINKKLFFPLRFQK